MAHQLAISVDTVRRLIRSGQLPAVDDGPSRAAPRYVVADVDLAAFIAERTAQPAAT